MKLTGKRRQFILAAINYSDGYAAHNYDGMSGRGGYITGRYGEGLDHPDLVGLTDPMGEELIRSGLLKRMIIPGESASRRKNDTYDLEVTEAGYRSVGREMPENIRQEREKLAAKHKRWKNKQADKTKLPKKLTPQRREFILAAANNGGRVVRIYNSISGRSIFYAGKVGPERISLTEATGGELIRSGLLQPVKIPGTRTTEHRGDIYRLELTEAGYLSVGREMPENIRQAREKRAAEHERLLKEKAIQAAQQPADIKSFDEVAKAHHDGVLEGLKVARDFCRKNLRALPGRLAGDLHAMRRHYRKTGKWPTK